MARKPTGIDVRKTKTGTVYRLRWREGGGRDGRQCSHTYTDRYKAEDALREIRIRGWRCACPKHAEPDELALPTATGEVTWGAYARRSIALRTGIEDDYRARFTRELDLHMEPLLDIPLAEVDLETVKAWVRKLELAGLSATTIGRLCRQAGSVQRDAVNNGLTRGNPFALVRTGRTDRDEHTEMVCLTPEEFARLEAALPEGCYRTLASLLYRTGLRWGEATALTAGAVDMYARQLRVRQAWKSDGHNRFVLGKPKSVRSRRTVTFGARLVEQLAPLLMGRPAGELVFTTAQGKPIRATNFRARVWLPAIGKAGLPRRPRVHDLRHSHASYLIAKGVPVPAISRRLGHESIQTTIDRYGHILPAVDDAVARAIDDL